MKNKRFKMPTSEKEVIEFEKKHKKNYEKPVKWSSVDEIIGLTNTKNA